MSSGNFSVGHDFDMLGLFLVIVIRLIHFVLSVAIVDVFIQLILSKCWFGNTKITLYMC
jgi:hypothetical protein